MNSKALVCLLALAMVIAVGCVSKVSGGHRAGVPFVKDTVEGRYDRPVDVVFNAAKSVVAQHGTISNESILHSETNQVKTLVAKVENRTVYVRVEPIEAQVTAIRVQARTSTGGRDLDLAHLIEKEVALKMVQ